MTTLTAGIDVSKATLDVATYPETDAATFPNTEEGAQALSAWLTAHGVSPVVLEATGGYERVVAALLMAAGHAVAVVNPRQVRDFAKSIGQLAKTDQLDATLLARYAAAVAPEPTSPPDAGLVELQALVTRRQQLTEMRVSEQQRLAQAHGRVRRDIKDHLFWLTKQLTTLDRDLDRWFDDHPQHGPRYRILRSVPGIGPVIAAILMAFLPELGEASRQELAALAGVAPFNCDSGRSRGQRHVRGGRAPVRRALYLAALVGARHNPQLRAFYQRLRGANKVAKVALVACMRKLLTILSALVKHNELWTPQEVNA